jgi:hypothetical protein
MFLLRADIINIGAAATEVKSLVVV